MNASAPEPQLAVATWNVCLGVEFESVLAAGGEGSRHEAARRILEAIERTRFPDRADAMARVIARYRPDVLALQELARFETVEGTQGRTLYSFADIMGEALARAGSPYVQVSCVDTFSGRLPIDDATTANFTSCDALLVRKDCDVDLSVIEVDDGHFENRLTMRQAGRAHSLAIRRGWSSVLLERQGRRVRVVVTHLDSLSAQVRRGQAHELVALLSESHEPVVVMGALNSGATMLPDASVLSSSSDDGVLEVLAGAGYEDAWLSCREAAYLHEHQDALAGGVIAAGSAPGSDAVDGATWGPAPELAADRDPAGRTVGRALTERLDYAFFDPLALVARSAQVVGAAVGDVTRTGPALLPSDHACVVVRLAFRGP